MIGFFFNFAVEIKLSLQKWRLLIGIFRNLCACTYVGCTYIIYVCAYEHKQSLYMFVCTLYIRIKFLQTIQEVFSFLSCFSYIQNVKRDKHGKISCVVCIRLAFTSKWTGVSPLRFTILQRFKNIRSGRTEISFRFNVIFIQ